MSENTAAKRLSLPQRASLLSHFGVQALRRRADTSVADQPQGFNLDWEWIETQSQALGIAVSLGECSEAKLQFQANARTHTLAHTHASAGAAKRALWRALRHAHRRVNA